jgi:hypothetical protein
MNMTSNRANSLALTLDNSSAKVSLFNQILTSVFAIGDVITEGNITQDHFWDNDSNYDGTEREIKLRILQAIISLSGLDGSSYDILQIDSLITKGLVMIQLVSDVSALCATLNTTTHTNLNTFLAGIRHGRSKLSAIVATYNNRPNSIGSVG